MQPSVARRRERRQCTGIAFGRTVMQPRLERLDLRVGQPPSAEEVTGIRSRFPWRHEATARQCRDQLRTVADFVVRDKTEWSIAASTVTGRARAVHDWGDVARKCGVCVG